jgi:phytoene dehydrogenase-like protein
MECGVDVRGIDHRERRVRGVETSAGGCRADVVVADVDAAHLYRDLLPSPRHAARVARAGRSTSGVVVLAGVTGATAGVAHHNVWFAADARREFDELAAGRLPADPTIYGCVTADAAQAPAGTENWFLLVNAPAGCTVDPATATALVLARLRDHGVDLHGRLLFTEALTPTDFAHRDRSDGGALYGTSSNGRRAAFVRPANRGPLRGLYLVGGSAHPGGGIPLVLTGARIVTELVAADG